MTDWVVQKHFDMTIHNEVYLSQPVEIQLFANIRAKIYWLVKVMFKLIDGVLYRQKPDQNTSDWLLAIPESLRESVLSLHHDLPIAGHRGVARTKSRLKEKGFLVSNVKRCRVLCTILQCLQPEQKEQGL